MRKPLFLSASIGVAFLMLASCATSEKSLQESGLTPLTHNELEMLMSRTRTWRWTNTNGRTGAGRYAEGGDAKVNWRGGQAEGSWRISGDKFCTRYPTVRRGNEFCYTVYKTGEKEYRTFLKDGSFYSSWVLTN